MQTWQMPDSGEGKALQAEGWELWFSTSEESFRFLMAVPQIKRKQHSLKGGQLFRTQ